MKIRRVVTGHDEDGKAIVAIDEVSRDVVSSDIPRMNPWNGAKPIILPGRGEAMVGRHRFPGAPAAFTAQNDA